MKKLMLALATALILATSAFAEGYIKAVYTYTGKDITGEESQYSGDRLRVFEFDSVADMNALYKIYCEQVPGRADLPARPTPYGEKGGLDWYFSFYPENLKPGKVYVLVRLAITEDTGARYWNGWHYLVK